MNAIPNKVAPTPWYRQPWPWLLMSGPAAVVVAGAITTTMAFRTSDGLVADDYYKQGLMINQALVRDQHAARRHLAATGWYVAGAGAPAVGAAVSTTGGAAASVAGGSAAGSGRIRIMLKGDSAAPPTIRLLLVHPTRAGRDHTVVLSQAQPGIYEGALDVPTGNITAGGRWLVTLEQGDWRLTGEWMPGKPLQLSSLQP